MATRKKCEHGRQPFFCKECKGGGICEHNKIKYHCIECKGHTICEHSKVKYTCKECKGKGICEHGKCKSRCKDCKGGSICEHGTLKYRCKECKGVSICEHGKTKYYCVDCKGNGLCEHLKQKYFCKECNGSAYCDHGKEKRYCLDCKGTAYCEHKRIKSRCKECNGASICEHSKVKSKCKECGGSSYCKHDKWKTNCKECGGSALCKTPGCETSKSKKYEGYCLPCFVYLFPDKPNSRNYKTKEIAVVEFLQTSFPTFTLVTDKKVADGCSRRRPDILVDFGEQVLCIDIDENMHISYDCSCENKRLMEISQDIGHRPLVFLRFNPDAYLDEKEKRVYSSWGLDGRGLSVIKRPVDWGHRLTVLKDHVQYWAEHRTEKTVEVVELFYDMNTAKKEEEEDDGTAKGGAGV